MLHGLDLFSGIGGITAALAPWVKPVAYCEIDAYCRGVLLSRMASGDLPSAPIWDDVRTLRGAMLPDLDIIYGGFPCQDLSVAGRGRGVEGERSGLVFEILRLVAETAAPLLFLENVPAIRTRGGQRVVGELAALGYDARWDCLSAYDVGAPHLRDRWFLLARRAAADADRRLVWDGRERDSERHAKGSAVARDDGAARALADSDCRRRESERQQELARLEGTPRRVADGCREVRQLDDAPSDDRYEHFWSSEPDVGRVADRTPCRVDRLRALGNAVVPQQAREAFRRLIGFTGAPFHTMAPVARVRAA